MKRRIGAYILIGILAAGAVACRKAPKPVVKSVEIPVNWFHQFPVRAEWVVNFTADADSMAGLSVRERREQIRDWLLMSLVAASDQPAEETAEILVEFPIQRPKIFRPNLQRGSTRSAVLPNHDVVVLVPESMEATRQDRIAALLDQVRFTAGAQPGIVHEFQYSILPGEEQAHVARLPEETVGSYYSSARGYQTALITDPATLRKFLEEVDDLTAARMEGGRLRLEGRARMRPFGVRFQVGNAAELYQADRRWREVQQRSDEAVRQHNARWGRYTVHSQEEADRLKAQAENEWQQIKARSDAEFQRVGPRLGCGFSLDPQPEGAPEPAYQRARYDCNLAGSETGMVLFYTDLLAKLWALDYAQSHPSHITDFSPMIRLDIPAQMNAEVQNLSHTRIWFGPLDGSFQPAPDALVFAPVATRVFAKSSTQGGSEQAPNAVAAIYVNWWNAHYDEIAAWEPEYRRLNQVMKWSLLFGWLEKNHLSPVAFLNGVRIDNNRWFPNWAEAQRDRLTFRDWRRIHFDRRGERREDAETLEILRSEPYHRFGGIWQLSGGVSLATVEDMVAPPAPRPRRKVRKTANGAESVDPTEPGARHYDSDHDRAIITSLSNGAPLADLTVTRTPRGLNAVYQERTASGLARVKDALSRPHSADILSAEGVDSVIRLPGTQTVLLHRTGDPGFARVDLGPQQAHPSAEGAMPEQEHLAAALKPGDYVYISAEHSTLGGMVAEIRNRGPPSDVQSVTLTDGKQTVRASQDAQAGLYLARSDLPDSLLDDPDALRRLAVSARIPHIIEPLLSGDYEQFAARAAESPQLAKTQVSDFLRKTVQAEKQDLDHENVESAVATLAALDHLFPGHEAIEVPLASAYLKQHRTAKAAEVAAHFLGPSAGGMNSRAYTPSSNVRAQEPNAVLAARLFSASTPEVRVLPVDTPDGVQFVSRIMRQLRRERMGTREALASNQPVYVASQLEGEEDWNLALFRPIVEANGEGYSATRIRLPNLASVLPLAIEDTVRGLTYVRSAKTNPSNVSSSSGDVILLDKSPRR